MNGGKEHYLGGAEGKKGRVYEERERKGGEGREGNIQEGILI